MCVCVCVSAAVDRSCLGIVELKEKPQEAPRIRGCALVYTGANFLIFYRISNLNGAGMSK